MSNCGALFVFNRWITFDINEALPHCTPYSLDSDIQDVRYAAKR